MKKTLFFALSLLLGAIFLLAGCGAEKPPATKKPAGPQVLNLFGWADYFDPEIIAEFEKQYNCKVNYDVFANNEELLAKMQAGGAQYDIIQPSDYMVAAMIKLGLLDKINFKNTPNLKNITLSFTKPPFDPSGEYTAIYTWGITGIAYNKKYVKQPPSSWADLWKPDYKGRVILLNDGREVLGMALRKNGFSNSTRDRRQLEAAFNDLKKLAPNVLAYDTDNIKQKFIAEEVWIGTMWSGDAVFTQAENPNIEYVTAKENGVIFADTLAIPKNAKNKELAEKFINYLYEPRVSARNFEAIGYIDPNEKAYEFHSKEYRENKIFNDSNAAIKNSEWLTDVGSALTLYDQYWTELKTIR
ncbi:MAG: spermidine/putrescine ABC transporter substrate-binding protein [Acidaminococcales bacterium]|jgi:spermidine/putrescine transport system substrate-binding protein|nr:spermidine/putrescine ABC transporter substrate-binding protein [Acidaminococcales bacterium]